jgi:hypothetical protein
VFLRSQVSAEKFVVDSKGRKTAVILPIDQFEKLMEDIHDLRIVAERRGERPIAAKEFTKRLKRRGLV